MTKKVIIRLGEIYEISNTINNKIYIGQTVVGYLTRFIRHKCNAKTCNNAFGRAIKLHGAENFKIKVIDSIPYPITEEEYAEFKNNLNKSKKLIEQENKSVNNQRNIAELLILTHKRSKTSKILEKFQNELDKMEIKYIAQYNSLVPNGYNLTKGGNGTMFSYEVIKNNLNGIIDDKVTLYSAETKLLMKQKILAKEKAKADAKAKEIAYIKAQNEVKANKKTQPIQKDPNSAGIMGDITYRNNVSKGHRITDAHNGDELALYMSRCPPRPQYYQDEGYAVIKHPKGQTKYFTSKKLTMDQKYDLAKKYLEELNNK